MIFFWLLTQEKCLPPEVTKTLKCSFILHRCLLYDWHSEYRGRQNAFCPARHERTAVSAGEGRKPRRPEEPGPVPKRSSALPSRRATERGGAGVGGAGTGGAGGGAGTAKPLMSDGGQGRPPPPFCEKWKDAVKWPPTRQPPLPLG